MLESEIEKAVCDYAKEKGLIPYKFTSPSRRSVPDRLFVGPNNLHFFIEFKRPGEKPTPNQAREMRRLLQKDQHVYVCSNVESGKWIIDSEVSDAATRLSAQGNRVQPWPRSDGTVVGHGPRQDRGGPNQPG